MDEWFFRGARSREVVGLNVGDVWFRLDNQLMHDGSSGMGSGGVGAFEVSDADVRGALMSLRDIEDVSVEAQPIVLWHSHVNTVEPSEHDVEHLPEWCMYGLVFHVPSRTTTKYGHGARHSALSAGKFEPLVDIKE